VIAAPARERKLMRRDVINSTQVLIHVIIRRLLPVLWEIAWLDKMASMDARSLRAGCSAPRHRRRPPIVQDRAQVRKGEGAQLRELIETDSRKAVSLHFMAFAGGLL